jgi:NhaA family Na+:H+ antiporter
MIRKLKNSDPIKKITKINLSESFKEFFENEKSAGLALMLCSIISLIIANSAFSAGYLDFWESYVGGLSISHWVNDGLMAIFFLLIGCELKRELYEGELSNFRNALLPIIAACGGVALPALLHFSLNAGTPTQAGIGIPMATDIAFALSILALAGDRVPASLKIFLTALAVIDDLIAIIVIALFYTSKFSALYLALSLGVFAVLMILNRLRFNSLFFYLLGGAVMWYFMYKSGVHATIAGVLLAFTIPYTPETDDDDALNTLEHYLHKPVAFFILPVFALANTGIIIGSGWVSELSTSNSLGIICGLFFGKVIGITILTFIAVKLRICRLPLSLSWKHIIGAGFLAGIGFTMSIFITNLAFKDDPGLINSSKMSILLTSLTAGIVGYIWLVMLDKLSDDSEIDSVSYEEGD